jgi:MFS family permease
MQVDGTARRALGILSVALVLSMTTWLSASSVVPQLRAEWDLSNTSAALLTIAVQLGFVAGALVSSFFNLSDLISPRTVIVCGAVGAATVNALLLASDGAASAVPLRFATGFFLAGVYPPALKLMATWYREGRGIALGIIVGALTLGTASPHLVNGLGGLDHRTVVATTSILTVAGGLLALRVPDGPFPFPPAVFDPRQFRKAFANRGVRLASLGYFGHMWELYAMWAWFAVFFGDALRLQGLEEGSAPAFAAFAVIGVGGLGCYVGGVLGEGWGRTRTTAVMMAASGVCAVVVGLLVSSPPPVLLGVGVVWGFTVVADSAQFSTMVTELADQSYVGTALTLQLALGFTLTVLTIWLIPVLEGSVGWRWAFSVLMLGPALGTVAMLRLRASPEARLIAGGRG